MISKKRNYLILLCFFLMMQESIAQSWENKMYDHGKITVFYSVAAIVMIGLSIKITSLNLQLKKDHKKSDHEKN